MIMSSSSLMLLIPSWLVSSLYVMFCTRITFVLSHTGCDSVLNLSTVYSYCAETHMRKQVYLACSCHRYKCQLSKLELLCCAKRQVLVLSAYNERSQNKGEDQNRCMVKLLPLLWYVAHVP